MRPITDELLKKHGITNPDTIELLKEIDKEPDFIKRDMFVKLYVHLKARQMLDDHLINEELKK